MKPVIRLLGLAVILLLLLVPGAMAQDDAVRAYYAGRIWPASAPPIDNGVMIVSGGKILAVGAKDKVEIPAGVEKIDLGVKVIIPGLVVAQTSLSGAGTDNPGTITPQLRAVDSYDTYGKFDAIVSGGVTTVQVSPGAQRLMPGVGGVVKLAGADPGKRIVREIESLRVVLGESTNPPKIFEAPIPADPMDNPLLPGRIQLATGRAGLLVLLRATMAAAMGYEANGEVDAQLAAVQECVKKRMPFRVTATKAVDIQAALALAEQYNLKLTLVDPEEIYLFEDQYEKFAAQGYSVIFDAQVRPGLILNESAPSEEEAAQPPVWKMVRDLTIAKVNVAIHPMEEEDLGKMLFVAGLVGQGGLTPQEILELVSVNPARMMGVADRVGSLAAGCDADFVVMSGDPFGTHAMVHDVFVDGTKVFGVDAESEDFTVVKVNRIYTGSGHVISGGAIGVRGKKISGVGSDVTAPPGAEVKQFPAGSVAIPGMIDMRTSLTESNQERMKLVSEGGITTVLNIPSGGSAAVRAYKMGGAGKAFEETVAFKFSLTGNVSSAATSLRGTLQRGKDYADEWTAYEKKLAEYKVKLAEYEKKLKEWEALKAEKDAESGGEEKADEISRQADQRAQRAGRSQQRGATPPTRQQQVNRQGQNQQRRQAQQQQQAEEVQEVELPPEPVKPQEPNEPDTRANLEPYRALFAGKMIALVEADRTIELEMADKIFNEEFPMKTMFIGARDACRIPGLIPEKVQSVLVGPELIFDIDGATVNQAEFVITQGGNVGFGSAATTGSRNLPLAVTYAVRRGLGVNDALAGLTSVPAKLLGLGERIGSIARGCDADLVVLSGPPFELTSRVLAVMVDGVWVYQERAKEN